MGTTEPSGSRLESKSKGNGEPLEELLAQYIRRANDGESLDRDKILKDHPECGLEIIKHLEIFSLMGGAGGAEPSTGAGALSMGGLATDTLGDYKLLREIGRGGMGVVYEAWENSMDRRVALKVLPQGVPSEAKAFTRFIREAKVAGKLNHPSIVSVFSMGIQADTPYFAMEFVEGETLAQILRRLRNNDAGAGEETASSLLSISRLLGSRLPGAERPAQVGSAESAAGSRGSGTTILDTDEVHRGYCFNAASAFADVAEGLEHAHKKGIIHRDIKPSNLILDRDGRLRILDFGLARIEGQESLTRSGSYLGTPLYMSPEQAKARKSPIDHRTDVYSLGTTLYEMLTWHPPFKGKDHQDTLSQIISRDPPTLRRSNARIPRDLETIVLKCLRKEPGGRYGTAEALAQDLRRFVRGDPIEARPEPAWKRTLRSLLGNRWRAAAVCAAVLLIAAAGLLIHKYMQEAREERTRIAQEDQAAKEGLYRDKVLGAVLKIALGRPAACERAGASQDGHDQTAEVPGGSGVALPEGMWADVEPIADPVAEAVAELEEAAEILPGNPEAHYHLARGYLELGRKEKARDALARALECNSGFVPAKILQSAVFEEQDRPEAASAAARTPPASAAENGDVRWANAWLRAYQARQDENWEESADALGELIEQEKEGVAPYLGFAITIRLDRGRMRLNAGDFDGAVEDFAATREIWPDLFEPELLLGWAYHLKGNPERAGRIFDNLGSREHFSDRDALRVVDVYHDLRDYVTGLEWIDRATPSLQRESRRVDFLRHLERQEERLAAAKKAVEDHPESVEALLMLGDAFKDLARLDEAVSTYRQALELDQNNVNTHVNLAKTLSEQGKKEQGLEEFQEAVRLDPDNAGSRTNLGCSLNGLGRSEEARIEHEKAVSLDPSLMVAHFNHGCALGALERDEEAIAAYRRALELDPNFVRALCNLGNLLRDSGEHDEALVHFENALAIEPDNLSIRNGHALTLLGMDKTSEAIAELRKIIEDDPVNGPAHHNLGMILTDEGELEEAIALLQIAVQLDPLNPDTLINLGRAHYQQGHLDRAAEAYKQAINLDSNYALAHHNLGVVYQDQGNLDEAVVKYRKAIELDEDFAMAHYCLGDLFFDQTDYENAAAPFSEAARLNPMDFNAHKKLGICLFMTGQYAESESAFRSANDLDDKSCLVHYGLANALREQGELEEAAAEYKAALRLNPNHASSYNNLGLIYIGQEKIEEAADAFKKALDLDPDNDLIRHNLDAATELLKKEVSHETGHHFFGTCPHVFHGPFSNHLRP